MVFPDTHRAAAAALIEACAARGLLLATVESCTGGLLGGCLTAVAGSSSVFERGLVTYSNAAKTDLAGVPSDLIDAHGAVSEPVARAMAEGAVARAPVDLALSITGVAGPGHSENKPAGLVYIGCARRNAETTVTENRFEGDRDAVRMATVAAALSLARRRLSEAGED